MTCIYNEYDNFELDPCVLLECGGHEAIDEEYGVEIDHWAVFGHLPEGGRESIASFKNQDDANKLFERLMDGLSILKMKNKLEILLESYDTKICDHDELTKLQIKNLLCIKEIPYEVHLWLDRIGNNN